ncbi:MAG: histidine kinase N-terminal 7TM domain-containing protein, partial [Pseudomonadota bacterium]
MANRTGLAPDSLASQMVQDSVVAFDVTGLVYLVVGLIVGCLGAAFSIREGRTRAAIPFFVTATFGAVWLILEAIARSAVSTGAAIFAYQFALIFAAMVPASFLWFTHKVTGQRRRTDWALRVAAVLAGAQFIALLWPGTIALRGAQPAFGDEFLAVGMGFTVYFAAVMLTCAAAYATQLRRHQDSDYRHRRARLLLVASVVGALSSVGFVSSLGVVLLVNSALVMAIFFALVAYVIARYRVSDITPGL